jgi:hypothetical protein
LLWRKGHGADLFAGILGHWVPWIKEADGPMVTEASKEMVVIEEL